MTNEIKSSEALKAYAREVLCGNNPTNSLLIRMFDEIIDNAPAVETKTSYDVSSAYDKGFITAMKLYSRPQGEWLKSEKGKTIFFCSECGREINTKPFTRPDNFPFCHCGADMRGEKE